MGDNRIERRFAPVEFRKDGESLILEGVAVRYGDEAQVGGAFREKIEPGAFGAIGDVILNMQHQRGRPLARTGAGGLILTDAREQLAIRAELPKTRDAEDAMALLEARVLRGFSVEFVCQREAWTGSLRTVQRADLVGIALVDRPAYPQSTALAARCANRAAGHAPGLELWF